jgi:membrane dipeptidase
MHKPLATCGGPALPAALCYPSLREGNVTRSLSTIFIEAIAHDQQIVEDQQYHAGDAAAAHGAGVRQIGWYAANPSNFRQQILIESADSISSPDELDWWHQRGVVAIGMAWACAGRYAGGNTTQDGLSDLGRALVKQIDRLGIIHDVSHLSDRAFDDLLACTDARIIATHSNCRAMLGGGDHGQNQRHLRDDQIRAIVARDGVIGLNLFSAFLSVKAKETGRATVEDCVNHIEHVCEIARDRRHVGLGSDLDGGFSAARLPQGIDTPVDYIKLAEALSAKGWSDAEVRGFAYDNWARIFGP